MLSENQLVNTRRALERTYIGVCTVTESVKKRRSDGSTAFEPCVKYENIPCRLSMRNGNSRAIRTAAVNSDLSYDVSVTVKLFMAPEYDIRPNSKIIVTQNSTTREYANSGFPAIYSTHQEISLTPAQNKA